MRFRFKKPKVSKKDLDKIGSTIESIRECPYCSDLKEQIKQCLIKHNVNTSSLRKVTTHNIKCKDCRNRIFMIKECYKKGHR